MFIIVTVATALPHIVSCLTSDTISPGFHLGFEDYVILLLRQTVASSVEYVKSRHTNEVSQYPVFWFLFSESCAASFQADRVRGNRSAGQQSSLCILQLLDIFITVFIEVTLNGREKKKKNVPLGMNCAILFEDKHSNGPLFFNDLVYDLVSNVPDPSPHLHPG